MLSAELRGSNDHSLSEPSIPCRSIERLQRPAGEPIIAPTREPEPAGRDPLPDGDEVRAANDLKGWADSMLRLDGELPRSPPPVTRALRALASPPVLCLSLFGWGFALCYATGVREIFALDQAIVYDGAWRILQGQVPYRDFVTPMGIAPIRG